MIGILANPGAVVLGTLLGMAAGKRIPERVRACILQGLGLCVILIGVSGALATKSVLTVILCVVLGGALGSGLRLERRLRALADRAPISRRGEAASSIGEGFVSATLLFCVGSMAIVGSLNAGLSDDASVLLAKAALDGVTAILFGAAMGAGVALSAVPLLVYQGGIALLARLVGPMLAEPVITEVAAVGSLLVLGLGLNMLECTKEPIPVADLLPAMFLPPLVLPLIEAAGRLL